MVKVTELPTATFWPTGCVEILGPTTPAGAATVIEIVVLLVPAALVAVTTTAVVPAMVGVPESTPVEGLITTPGGNGLAVKPVEPPVVAMV